MLPNASWPCRSQKLEWTKIVALGGKRLPGANSWQRISIDRIEDLKDAVYGAGLEAT